MKNTNNNYRAIWQRSAFIAILACVAFLVSACGADNEKEGVINLLFIGHDQREGSGYHLSHAYAPRFNESLGREKIFMDYREDLKMLTDEGLADVDALMLYGNYDHLTPEQEAALLRFVENGGAFLPVHSASACFGNSEAFVKLVGGRFHSHGMETFTTRIAPGQEDHPILQGFEGFETRDETYVHRDHNEDGRTALMLREDEPWTWVREQGKGRVFYTAYGHDQATWGQLAFHDLLIRGILWSVGDEKRAANRALVATLPIPVYEDKGTIPNYRRVSPEPQFQHALEVEDSQALSMVPEGFELQFFVGEPDIINPMAFAWDERGRLFVVESVDYPHGMREDGKGNDRISMCEDTDGDGRANHCKVFADGLNIPTGLTAVDGGWIVAQAPHFLFLKDTTGDGKADVRRVLNSVWGTRDTHAGPSNLRYGHDNRIWGAVGYSGTESESQGEFQNGLYRMDVDGSNIEPIGQLSNNTWGLGLSEDFEVFGSTANNAPAWHVPVWRNYVYGQHEEVPPKLAAKIDDFSQIFPVTHNFLQVDAHGRYTAGAGFNLYTARAFPERYWNRGAFIGEPTAHLLGQFFLEPDGATYRAKNRGAILASTDEWLSPVYADVGPDGQLWVADWYNFIIQHNPIPTEVTAGFDAESGKGNAHVNPLRDRERGRIYRIVAKDAPAVQPLDLSEAGSATLVATLANDNLFWRLTAQRKLVREERQDAVPALQKILQGKPSLDAIGLDVASIHAIWSLHGLGAFNLDSDINKAIVQRALQHPSAATRKNAVIALLENSTRADLAVAAGLIDDSDARTRLWSLLAVAQQAPAAAAGEQLLRHRTQLPADEWLAEVFMLAALRHEEHYWAALNRADIVVKGSFLRGFDSPEKTPEYLLAKRSLAGNTDGNREDNREDLTKTLNTWKQLPDGRLGPFSVAVLDAWRDRGREPSSSELKGLQALIDQVDSEAQMALKLRAAGLALTFDKVEEEAYDEYHAQHTFEAHVWEWGPPQHGEPLYQQHCASCHGGDGGGDEALGAPTLAAMDNWYAQTQLQKFLAGLRGTHFKDPDGISMRAALDFLQVESEPERQISFLAHYVETLPRVAQPATVDGDVRRGAVHYASCATCHGTEGEGNGDLGAPRLTGQADWYLLQQLRKFRSGARGSDPRDARGQQMATFANILPDEQALKDVVSYIRSLSATKTGDPTLPEAP
jgi:putative membrane-bound dehydrogenase-like protein